MQIISDVGIPKLRTNYGRDLVKKKIKELKPATLHFFSRTQSLVEPSDRPAGFQTATEHPPEQNQHKPL